MWSFGTTHSPHSSTPCIVSDREGSSTPFPRARRVEAPRGEAVGGQRLDDLRGVPGIPGLDRHVDGDALGRHVEEEAAVRHFEDVGAELAEAARERAEEARAVVAR